MTSARAKKEQPFEPGLVPAPGALLERRDTKRATTTEPLPPEVPMSSTERDVDHALAYPEPPASPLWHRHGGAQARPLTPAQQKRNAELLVLAQRTTRPRTPRPTEPLAEAI